MSRALHSPLRRFALAGGAVALAAAVRWAIDPWLGDGFPYAIFLVAVIVVAFFGRFRLSLFATAAAALVGNYLFVAPRYALAIPAGRGAVTLILFLTAGIISALLADYVGRTRERLRVTAEDRAAHDAEIRAERARLQDIIDSIPGVVWEAWGAPDSSQQRIDFVSTYVQEMLGYTPEEWTATPNFWLQRVAEDDRERAARAAAEIFAAGKAGEDEFRWMAKDGRLIWVLARSIVIKDESGTPIGMRGVTFDITDRKEVEQRLALLAEISTAGLATPSFQELACDIARRTAHVVGDYCIIRMYRQGRLDGVAYAHVAAEAEPLIRRLTEHPTVASQSARYAAIIREPRTLVDNDVPATAFAHVDRTDLEAVFERFRARRGIICPLMSHGELLGTLSLGRAAGPPYSSADVRLVEAIASQTTIALDNAALFETAQRDAEEARIARAEAEDAGRVKDEFLATLSHELRTPLNAILGWAHMLRDPALAQDRRQAAIDTIVRNAQSQEQLISDILDVQRIMAGKIRLSPRNVDLGAIIRSAAETVQPSATAKHVRLQLLVDLDVPPVWGDPDRLQQIIWNLLSNAIKFAPNRGHVEVRLLKDEADCELIVRDNGPGINAEFIPHMFERFRQADSSTTRTHKGLGLGLAIVRNLVEMHGGTITAENVAPPEGTGAIFTIRLPRQAARPVPVDDGDSPALEQAAAWHNDSPALDGIRVLVVEDDRDARELIGAILESSGAAVTLTASADEGFAAAAAQRPDVIVSDIEMPAEDGYSFIRRIRALAPDAGGAVPAAALTAYASPADRMKVLGAGFNIHVAKPVQPAELAIVVASLAGRRA